MAGFHTKTFIKHDDYMTPKYAWREVAHLIPKDKVIWEAFYGDGESGKHLTELGFNTIHEPVDFFKNDLGEIIVSNPPFSKAKEIIKRLSILDKPFMLIFPVSKMNTSYFREFGIDHDFQIIIPRKRINFLKKVNGEVPKGWSNRCNFDCHYYCYKMNLPKSIYYLTSSLDNIKEKNISMVEKDGDYWFCIKIRRKKELVFEKYLETDKYELKDAILARDTFLEEYKRKQKELKKSKK
jgi:hypothetical protein